MFRVGFSDYLASGEYQYQLLASDGYLSQIVDFSNEFTYTSFAVCGMSVTGRTPAGLAMRHPRLLGWHYPSLESWNVRTGEWTVIPLVDEDGNQLDWTEDVAAMDSDTAVNLIRDGWMYWMSGVGDLARTNLSSGVTQVLNDDLHDDSGAASLSSQFLPGKAVALRYDGSSRRALELAEYSLPDGTMTRRIPLDALAGRLRDLRPQGFAANPQYAGA